MVAINDNVEIVSKCTPSLLMHGVVTNMGLGVSGTLVEVTLNTVLAEPWTMSAPVQWFTPLPGGGQRLTLP